MRDVCYVAQISRSEQEERKFLALEVGLPRAECRLIADNDRRRRTEEEQKMLNLFVEER